MSGTQSALIGAGAQYANIRYIQSSTTFTAVKTGKHRVTVIGAGGGGANPTVFASLSSGGAAGGFTQKEIYLTVGQTATVTIGAGGLVGANPSNGSTGGTTSWVDALNTLTAYGGEGGKLSGAAAIGGIATGGDINVQGGNSGVASRSGAGAANGAAFTGGGAVGILGIGFPSGNATTTRSTGTAYSGGAGVGGKSGDAIDATALGNSGGGGSGGPSPDASSVSGLGGPDIMGTKTAAATLAVMPPGFSNKPCPFGGGGNGAGLSGITTPPPGGGQSGGALGTGGKYAGGSFGPGGIGAGGGGCYGNPANYNVGGQGEVIVEF